MHLLRSLRLSEARLSPKDPGLSPVLNNLGLLYTSSERFAEAEAIFLRALAIEEAAFGKEHPELANVLSNLGILYVGLGREKEAEVVYRRALEIREAKLGKDHPHVASSLSNLAHLYSRQGRLVDAEPLFLRALAIGEAKLGENHPEVATYCNNLATVYQNLKRLDEAEPLFLRSLQITQATMGRDHPDLTAPLQNLGMLNLHLNRAREAEQYFRHALRISEKYQADHITAGLILQGLAAVQMQIDAWRKNLLAQEVELNRALAKRSVVGETEIGVDAVRAVLSPNSALVEYVRCPNPFGSKDASQVRYYAFVFLPGAAAPRLIDLGDSAPIDKAVIALRAEFTDFQDKLRECETQEEIHDLEKVQEKRFQNTSKGLQSLVFAPVRKILGTTKLVHLAPDGELNRVPFEALVDDDGKYLVEHFQFAYLSCGRDLLRPRTKAAAGTVVFANPDFRLGSTERHELATKLLGDKAPSKVLVASRGTLETRSIGWKALPGAAAEAKDIQTLLDKGEFGPVQAYTAKEALEEVFKAMPAPRVLHLATHGFSVDHDPDAERRAGSGAGWARGQLKQMDNPLLRSGIVLAGANDVGKDKSAKVEDGWVTAEEIALLNLSGTELVVLSACQTGLGDIKNGEGVSGLRWAFLYAGARTLVTSLFEVPDTETRELMKHFYGRLNSEGKLAALHGAQLSLIQSRRAGHGAAHPFFWASFVLVGDAR